MTDWQPIFSAPHDRPILVRGGGIISHLKPNAYAAAMWKPIVVEWLYDPHAERHGWLLPESAGITEIIAPTEWGEIPT